MRRIWQHVTGLANQKSAIVSAPVSGEYETEFVLEFMVTKVLLLCCLLLCTKCSWFGLNKLAKLLKKTRKSNTFRKNTLKINTLLDNTLLENTLLENTLLENTQLPWVVLEILLHLKSKTIEIASKNLNFLEKMPQQQN